MMQVKRILEGSEVDREAALAVRDIAVGGRAEEDVNHSKLA